LKKILLFVILVISLPLIPAYSLFDLWKIKEVFSNADGSIQYIELFTTSISQQFISGHSLTATSDGSTNIFPYTSNSGSPTANQHLLIATPGFSAIAGVPPPDFTIPAMFFDPTASTITIIHAGFDTFTFSGSDIPLDGFQSLNPNLSTSDGSPTNFSGVSVTMSSVDNDGDGISNILDNCPYDSNLGQEDHDGDEIGDACDPNTEIIANTVATDTTFGGDLTVSASFTVPSGIIVDFDFVNFKITVKAPNGKILIEFGGKIT